MPASLVLLRLAVLAAAGALLWSAETRFALFPDQDRRTHLAPNLALTALTLALYAALGATTAALSLAASRAHAGLLGPLHDHPWLAGALGVAGLDLFSYFAHASMHRLPWLWRAHRVHHCDAAVDVTTAFRQHPIESLWRVAWQLAGVALFGVGPVALLVYLSLSSVNALLEHANVRVPFRLDAALQRAWVTPNMHKWHHSSAAVETDSNYGNLLSLWDKLFRSYTEPRPFAGLCYGLDQPADAGRQRLGGLLALPFAAR